MVNQSLFYVLKIFAYLHLIRDLIITTVIDGKIFSKSDVVIVILVQSYIMLSFFGLLRAISGLKYNVSRYLWITMIDNGAWICYYLILIMSGTDDALLVLILILFFVHCFITTSFLIGYVQIRIEESREIRNQKSQEEYAEIIRKQMLGVNQYYEIPNPTSLETSIEVPMVDSSRLRIARTPSNDYDSASVWYEEMLRPKNLTPSPVHPPVIPPGYMEMQPSRAFKNPMPTNLGGGRYDNSHEYESPGALRKIEDSHKLSLWSS